MSVRRPPRHQPLRYYWPQAGIGVGLALNMAGLLFGRPELIGTGSNVLTICGLFLAQRKRRNGGDR